MPTTSRTITITAHCDRDDIARGIELSVRPAPPGQMRKSAVGLAVLAGLAVLFGVLTAYAPLAELWSILMMICVLTGGLVLLHIVIYWLLNTVGRKVSRKRQMKELEAEEDQSFTASFAFEENRLTSTYGIITVSNEYSELTQCDEYEDGLYIERDGHGYYFIPARYISAADHAEISRRLSEKCKVYRVVSPMRAPAEAAEAVMESPDTSDSAIEQPVLISELRWTPTDEEINEAVKLVPSNNRTQRTAITVLRVTLLIFAALMVLILSVVRPFQPVPALLMIAALGFAVLAPHLVVKPARKEQRKIMESEQETGARLAFCDRCMLVRLLGDDIPVPYAMVGSLLEDDRFVSFCIDNNRWRIVVPLRVVEDREKFLAMLAPDAVNGEESAEQAGLLRSEHPDSLPLGDAEPDKGRILLSARFDGKDISARRLTGKTELVIDGKVYAEQKGMVEDQYVICAWMDGIMYSFSFNSATLRMRLMAGGRRLAEKTRVI